MHERNFPGWSAGREPASPSSCTPSVPSGKFAHSQSSAEGFDDDVEMVQPAFGRPPPGTKPPPPAAPPPRNATGRHLDSVDDGPGGRPQPPRKQTSILDRARSYRPGGRRRKSTAAQRYPSASLSSVGTSRSDSIYSEVELGESVLDSQQLMLARAAISGFAVLMLWMSSAFVVRGFLRSSDLVPYTSPTHVVDSIMLLINETENMRNAYSSCVREQLLVCNATLTYRVNSEAVRAHEAREANAQAKDQGQVTSTACVSARAEAYASVSTWQQNADPATTPAGRQYLASCSADDRAELEALTGDTTAQRSASMQLVTGYSRGSQSTVSRLGDYAAARAAYDYEYLRNRTIGDEELDLNLNVSLSQYSAYLRNSINGIDVNMTEFLACASFSSSMSCPTGQGAVDMVNQAQARLVSQYNSATAQLDSAKLQAQVYIDEASTQLSQGTAALSQIYTTLSGISAPTGGNLWDDLFPSNSFTMPSLGIPPTSGYYPTFPATPTLSYDGVPTASSIAAAVQPHIDSYQQTVGDAIDRAAAEAGNLVPAIRTNVSLPSPFACGGIPCDYNPPRPNLTADAEAEVVGHEQESDEFESDMAVALDAFDEARNAEQNANGTDGGPRFSAVNASDYLRDAANTAWLSYKTYQDAGLDMEDMLAWFSEIWLLLQALDTIWRCMETVRIIRKFWGRSALSVTPIDVTSDPEAKSTATSKVTNPAVQMMAMATHPIVVCAVVVTFSGVIGYVLYSFYMIPYGLYINHCTSQCTICDGTFLTRNAYSIAFNYATNEGNSLRLTGIDDYEIQRAEACTAYGESSAQSEQQLRSDYNLIIGSHTRAQADVSMMRSCYDEAYLDASFTASPVLDATGEPYALVSTSLSEPACAVTMSNATLEDGTFDCRKLPECEVRCDDLTSNEGVDGSAAEELYALARSAMCTTQHWLHSIVVRNIFVIIIWIFINIGRIILMMGVVRLSWDHLNSGYFAFLATCKHDGTHTYDPEELAEKVRKMLMNMKTVGVALVIIALLAQAMWLAPLLHFSEGLKASLA